MFGQDFQFKNLGIRFSADDLNNLFEPGIHTADQYRTAVLWTPYNMIFTGVNNVVIRFVLYDVR